MYRSIIIALATLAQFTGSFGFLLSIKRDLNNSEVLEKDDWILVEVNKAIPSVIVKFNIPAGLPYSDAFIFFANEEKKILQVKLNETTEGQVYGEPHKLIKKIKGEETTKVESDKFNSVEASFPESWLPENCSKVNAAVLTSDGRYYNLYKIQNFKISLPDLLVLEEYEDVKEF